MTLFEWGKMRPLILGVMALALVDCGGDGASPGTASPSAGGGLPTTNPPPTPPLPPNYLSARNFNQDRIVDDFGARQETFRPFGLPAQSTRTISLVTTSNLGTIGFDYRAATRSYRAKYSQEAQDFTRVESITIGGGSLVGDQDYRPSDPSPLRRYFRVVETDNANQMNNLDYVGYVSWSDFDSAAFETGQQGEREVIRYHLYGSRTIGSDIPTTGTAIYPLQLTLVPSSVELSINWVTGLVSGTARVPCKTGEACPGNDFGEFRLSGRFDGSLRLLGTFDGSAGYTGSFVGSFYGPNALELGIVGDLKHTTQANSIFVDTAKRKN